MKKFEYDIVVFEKAVNNEEFMREVMNQKGAQGWELTSTVPYISTNVLGNFNYTSKVNMFFKRELLDE
jgi:starvation-inducible outer membrane lipoprotein